MLYVVDVNLNEKIVHMRIIAPLNALGSSICESQWARCKQRWRYVSSGVLLIMKAFFFSITKQKTQRTHFLNDEYLVDCTNPTNRDALLLAQHGCRHRENRQEQVSPSFRWELLEIMHDLTSKLNYFTCRLFPSSRFGVENERSQKEYAADDFGPPYYPRDLRDEIY